VSHPSLEAVVKASASEGLSCKLTGAGGGGCAITLLPIEAPCETDSMEVQSGSAVCAIDQLKASLKGLGFEAFESSLAGDGVQWP
jgi:mevalonate kinase